MLAIETHGLVVNSSCADLCAFGPLGCSTRRLVELSVAASVLVSDTDTHVDKLGRILWRRAALLSVCPVVRVVVNLLHVELRLRRRFGTRKD